MLEPPSTQSGTSTNPARHQPRKRPLAHPGVLVLAGLAVLLGAYALGYLPQFGSLLQDAIRSSQSTEIPVFGPAVYGIAGLAAFLILIGLLKSVDRLVLELRGSSPLKTRPAKAVEHFIEEAAATKIDLPQLVESAPPLREDRSGSPERAAEEVAAPTLAPARRLSDSAQRKALHAATLVAIESGSLPPAQVSGLHRRASDYTGPRRRATDNRSDPEFQGPYRRGTDRSSAELQAADRLAAERPATDRLPQLSGERKAPAAPDPAELNRRDPFFVPPRNKRNPEPSRTV